MSFSIRVENLRKHYDLAAVEVKSTLPRDAGHGGGKRQKVAVDGITLDIGMGERVGIVGRNGAGKSTFLHMLAELTRPTSGSIQVEGKVTAVMTLGVGLREHATGRENIYIDGEVQGRTREQIDAVIDEIIDFAELGEFIDLPVRTYSTGMKSRLGFAMISCLEPEILIIDEALSAGDAHFANKATAKIRELCERGKIVIIVSHSMNSIQSMCNRCLWIDQGKVIMDGTPATVCSAYVDAVRGEDEARLLERFKSEASREFSRPGWAVDSLQLLQGDGNGARMLVEAGEDLVIRTKIRAAECDATTRVTFEVTRLDGLQVARIEVPAAGHRTGEEVRLSMAMRPLVLGQGVYRMAETVWHGGDEQANRSVIFEVFTQKPPAGGRPLMLYPSRIRAIPVMDQTQ